MDKSINNINSSQPMILWKDIIDAIGDGTLQTITVAGCKYIINPDSPLIADFQYVCDKVREAKKSRQEQRPRVESILDKALEVDGAAGAVLGYIDHRFDALERNIFRAQIATMPDSNYSDEKIVADIDYELSKEARNDTLATDRIARLANRIEFYGRTDAEFAAKNRYWEARVAYLRHGDFPNPGIDRNSPAFTKILKECVDMIRPSEIPAVQKECPE